MSFAFNTAVFKGSSDFTFESAGTLAKLGKGHAIKFTKNNLANDTQINKKGETVYRRVALQLSKDDEQFTLPCSEPLSRIIRSAIARKMGQKEILASLMPLDVMIDPEDDDRQFLMQPSGSAGESFLVNDLVKMKEMSYEDMIGELA